MKNIRDHDRDMYIYHARKDEKRTFADIGRELGITGNRVRQVFRRTDWQLNRFSADHYLNHPERVPEYARQEQ